jgi:hypothetical protein
MKDSTMCDYSLEHVASRPAAAGERVITTKFANAITLGFGGADNPGVAVCLLPGTELAFDREVAYRSRFSMIPDMRAKSRVARFRQIDLDNRHVHHDALEFASGEIVQLARLAEGQVAIVIQLPHVAESATAAARPQTETADTR